MWTDNIIFIYTEFNEEIMPVIHNLAVFCDLADFLTTFMREDSSNVPQYSIPYYSSCWKSISLNGFM